MGFTTVVEPDELARHLDEPEWVVCDCRFDLKDAEAGRRAYRVGHIPGARYAHLDEDLSGPIAPATGRHPLPDANAMAARLGAWGVSRTTQVVAYDDGNGAIAARLWWLLRWLGHDSVAVLEGGIERWRREGRALTMKLPVVAAAAFLPDPRPEMVVETAELTRHLRDDTYLVVDAREAERFAGIAEPIDAVAGHIPGAVNHPFANNLATEGWFRSAVALERAYRRLLGGRAPGNMVHMCGSGVTACHNILAMQIAGLHGARLYPGSWSEWIRDAARPVATGLEER